MFAKLAQHGVHLPVILVSARSEVPVVVEAIRAGALNYLEKPCEGDMLAAALREAVAWDAEHREEFFGAYDYIADCIDLVSCKVDLIRSAMDRGIPVISALGTGNKQDAEKLTVCDISKTSGCPLARVVRKELRKLGIEHHTVVFSPEEPLPARQYETPPPGRRSVPGSLVWVPATAGLLMCRYIVLTIAEKE